MKIVIQQTQATVKPKRKDLVHSVIMRVFEMIICLIALTVLAPFLLVIGILIRIDSPGPVFFTQERLGKDARSFKIIKLRTMYIGAEKNGPRWADKDDKRITGIGYYLRKYRIDEIPQFINVLLGDMALVGPRPERPVFVKKFENEIPGFRDRLSVKPGITGWAQINGGYDLTPREKLDLDIYYIDNCSFSLDLKILLWSIPVVLFSKGWR